MKANEFWMPMDKSGNYWPKWADKWKTLVVSDLNANTASWRLQGIKVVKVEIVPARKSPQKKQPRRKEP